MKGAKSVARLRHGQRLQAPAAFRRAFRSGIRLDGPLFQLIAVPNGLQTDRLGLVASRKLGGAVARNRSKRLLRESFRRNSRQGAEALDLVLIPKREIVDLSGDDVACEYRERLRRLASRRFPRNPKPPVSG